MLLTTTLWVVLALSFNQVSCSADQSLTSTAGLIDERSDSGSLWESDIYFIQKLSQFFGGGSKDNEDKGGINQPIRRNDRRGKLKPEMKPPQLYYPDRTDVTDRSGAPERAPFPPVIYRGSKKFPPGRGRPPVALMKQGIPGNRLPNIRREKVPLRRRHPGIRGQRPLRLRGEVPVRTTTTASPSFFEDLYASLIGGNADDERPVENEINIISSPRPINYHSSRLPPFTPFTTVFQSPPPIDGFTRHVDSSMLANHVNNNPVVSTVPTIGNVQFAPSQHLGPILTPQNIKLQESVQSEAARLDQALALSRPFHAISHPDPNVHSSPKIRRKVHSHRRPPPRPQRIQVVSDKISKDSVDDPNFEPSPKEGSMLADAFQPIFRASQSLDVELPESFMKPMHIASARALSFPKPAPPPEVLNFFEGEGARPLLGLNAPLLHRD